MAEMTYPPWSAPTTMDRNRKKPRKAQTEIKKKKPWWKRSQRKPKKLGDRSALPPPPGQDKMTYPPPLRFGEFSPFGPGRERINPLSGGGTPFLFQQLTGGMAYPPGYPPPMRPINEAPRYEKSRHQEEEMSKNEMFSPPTPKPSRPPLSNILPMFDNPNVNKTKLEKTQSTGANKLPKHAPPSGRRSSTPAVTAASEVQRALNKQRPTYTSPQSTTSDITYQRMGRKRRASAIRVLPTLPSGESYYSAPSIDGEKQDSEGTSTASPSDVMYVTPPNLTSSADKDPSMYGWTEQPHEQLQKLEEELEGEGGESKESLKKFKEDVKKPEEEEVKKEGPEGEETKGTFAWEKEQKHEPVGKTKSEPIGKSKQEPAGKSKQKQKKIKSKKSKSVPNEEDKVTDFAEEFAKQLTLGDSFEDVLY